MNTIYDSSKVKPMPLVDIIKAWCAKHVECADCNYDYERHLLSCPYCTSEWIIVDGKAILKQTIIG